MLTTVEGVYKIGAIELSEKPVGLREARVLVTFLSPKTLDVDPKVLYGAWKDRVPPALDVEEAIKEIRQESAKRLELETVE